MVFTMQAEQRAMRMIETARARQADMRSVLRLEQIAIKGRWNPALLSLAEQRELCALVLQQLMGDPAPTAMRR